MRRAVGAATLGAMHARGVERQRDELRGLRTRVVEGLVLGPTVFAGALVASHVYAPLAVPLFVGASFVAVRAMIAFVRRQLLIEDLALDSEALAIDDVRRFALRAASPKSRAALAQSIRRMLEASDGRVKGVEASRAELEELADALEDERLELELTEAVRLHKLDSEGWLPFYEPGASSVDARARLRHILNGFHRPQAT